MSNFEDIFPRNNKQWKLYMRARERKAYKKAR